MAMRQILLTFGSLLAVAAANAQSGATIRVHMPSSPPYQAISRLGDTLRAFPLSAETRERYRRQMDEAWRSYERAPTNADSIIWLARRLGYLGDIREAIDIYTRGIVIHPDNPWLYRHRGHRYISVRELDKAIADLEKAATLVAGKPDIVEEDGQPNARNMPIGTLHSNIAYHLGLAYYLKGDFAAAEKAYRRCLERARGSDDRLASATDWLYMTLRRLGRTEEAARLLEPIHAGLDVTEDRSYLNCLLLYKGVFTPEELLRAGGDPLTRETYGYAVGNWHLVNGRKEEARAVFERVVAGPQWPAFGHVAAEADLARMK